MKVSLLLIIVLIFSGCSLRYNSSYQDEADVPEFIFTDATFTKYEDNTKKLSLSAASLEQYSQNNSMYAKDVSFQLLNKAGEVETEGSCHILAANSDDEKYTLFDQIKVKNFKEDFEVTADTLRWNGKSEQLTSSRNDMVSIKKGDTFMMGSGFSASAVSKSFSFTGVISGEFTKDEENNEAEENSSEDTILSGEKIDED
ncbi:MAG: LPS export ABC transporter periplasmic protein LptC [Treponema sp.]|nr:LPS export ABC transporter periplasmic protein LptC [Treponema sp.]